MGNWERRVRQSEEEFRIAQERIQAEQANKLEVLKKAIKLFSVRALLQEVRDEVWGEGEICELSESDFNGLGDQYRIDTGLSPTPARRVHQFGLKLTTEIPIVYVSHRKVTKGRGYSDGVSYSDTVYEHTGYHKGTERISLGIFASLDINHHHNGSIHYEAGALTIADVGFYLDLAYKTTSPYSIVHFIRNPSFPGWPLVDSSRPEDKPHPEVLRRFESLLVKIVENRRRCNSLPTQIRQHYQKEIIRLEL